MQIGNRLIKWYLQRIKGLSLPRDLVKDAISRNYDNVAIIDGEREITYGRLYERAKKLANALLGLGLHKGDKLAVLLFNCQEYFEIRIAAYLTGIVLVPIVWDMELGDITFILNDCEVKALIYHAEIIGENIERLKKETGVKTFIEITSPLTSSMSRARNHTEVAAPRNDGVGASERPRNDMAYEDLLSQGEPVEPRIKLKGTDLASINFSSGTTGRPKGIMLLQKSWTNSFYSYVLNSPGAKRAGRTILHILSFSTAGGTAFLPVLFLGAKNIIMSKFNTEKAIALILKHKVNGFFISPSLFIVMLDYCKSKDIRLSLDGIVVGTEAMPRAKLEEAIEFFGPIIQHGYGMAEVLPPLSLMFPGLSHMNKEKPNINKKRLLSCGKALEGVRLKIIDKDGKMFPPGKAGNIIIKSATVFAGYWNNPELTQERYKDGWFYTDDYGYLDKDKYLYILGRKENILKEDNGEIIFARQVEEVIHRHRGILEACVFSDSQGKIYACVSLKKQTPKPGPEELIRFCRDSRLDKDDVPDTIKIYPELPKNASGKLDRRKIASGTEIY